jgi:hypothetical protein
MNCILFGFEILKKIPVRKVKPVIAAACRRVLLFKFN